MKLLLVVDMQNDFIDGTLGSEEAVKIVEKVADKINLYKSQGFHVVFTKDTHEKDYLDTQEGQKLPVEHCIRNTPGWEIKSSLNTEGSKIINKPTFGSLDLPRELIAYSFDEIEIIGLCTDICVISNAVILKAAFPEIPITVDSACCAGVTKDSHKNAIEAMKMCQINIINEKG